MQLQYVSVNLDVETCAMVHLLVVSRTSFVYLCLLCRQSASCHGEALVPLHVFIPALEPQKAEIWDRQALPFDVRPRRKVFGFVSSLFAWRSARRRVGKRKRWRFMHEVPVRTGPLDWVTKVMALFINLVYRFLADAREAPRGLCSRSLCTSRSRPSRKSFGL